MKKIFFIIAAATAFVACDPHKPDSPEEQKNADFAKATHFEASGTNTVPNVEGENHDLPFTMDGIRAEVVIVTDNTLDIYLYAINFSSKMPVTIDMVIPGASYTRTDNRITISGDNIVPLMGEREFDKYVVTALNGFITSDSLYVNNGYGPYPDCTYAGKITDKW